MNATPTALETLKLELASWDNRLTAHTQHGFKVNRMFKLLFDLSGKARPSRQDYDVEWQAYNNEEKSLKAFATIRFHELAKLAGVELVSLKGWRFEIK